MSYNLLPEQYRPQKPLYIGYFLSAVYLIMCVGLGIFIYTTEDRFSDKTEEKVQKEKEYNDIRARSIELDTEYSKINEELDKDEDYKVKKRLESEYDSIDGKYNFNYSEFLKRLGTITPMEIGVQSIQAVDNKIILEVQAMSKEYLNIFEKNIIDLNMFSLVQVLPTEQVNTNLYTIECLKQ